MKIRLKFTLSLLVGVIGLLGASFPAAQAATSTTHYSLTKPAVNDPVDQDLWGAEINSSLDTIDATMFGLSTPAESALTFTDITTNNVSTSKHGFCPKLPNDATKFLDGTGNWSSMSSPVTSVAGRTGAVVLSISDISGLISPSVTAGTSGKMVVGAVKFLWGQTPANNTQGGVSQTFWEAFSGTPYNIQLTPCGGNSAPTYGAQTSSGSWSSSGFTEYQSFSAATCYFAIGPS